MTRKRFKKLMMALGIPRNDLNVKLKKGSRYTDLVAVMHADVLLMENIAYTDTASAAMVIKAISEGDEKKIGKVYRVLSKYRNTRSLLTVMSMDASSKEFLEKHKDFYDACVVAAKNICGVE